MAGFAPARLTAALLARKGYAVPSGYTVTPLASASRRPVAKAESPDSSDLPGRRAPSLGRAAKFRPASQPTQHPDRARISLRLDNDRHLRLRLTAAHLERHLQDVLIEALDRYLDQVGPDVLKRKCACLEPERSRRKTV